MAEQKQSQPKPIEKAKIKDLLKELSYADSLVVKANYPDLELLVPKLEFLGRLKQEKSKKVGGKLHENR